MSGIDIDHCVDEHGSLSPLAQDIVSIMHSPTEYSPSGTGIHILFRATLPEFDKHRWLMKNEKNGVEVYIAGVTNRYLTLTGNWLPDTAFDMDAERTNEVIEVLNQYMRNEREIIKG